MGNIRNLVFDIGNVIIDIDYAATVAEFQKLSSINFSEIVSYSKQHQIFDLFEIGKISPKQFRDELKKFLNPGVTDTEIDYAWNAILVHYPPQKIELLKHLKKQYPTFALSNINEIHIASIDKVAREQFDAQYFSDFFHAAYYSNEVGCRKPERDIYEYLLQHQNIKPEETLFIDDKAENVEAARMLGIQAYQLTKPDNLHKLLNELSII